MQKFKWTKSGKLVVSDGTTIIYSCDESPYTIESRKKQITHANGYPGTWEHTSYFVVKDGKDIKEFQTLKDAKDYVEDL
ncbi:MAG: hypothetical protein IIY57_04565 [Erysipelotrichaceae bacterium]|nr:hypothetical protein [Erysipelotrichaceae bacterium]